MQHNSRAESRGSVFQEIQIDKQARAVDPRLDPRISVFFVFFSGFVIDDRVILSCCAFDQVAAATVALRGRVSTSGSVAVLSRLESSTEWFHSPLHSVPHSGIIPRFSRDSFSPCDAKEQLITYLVSRHANIVV